MAKLTLLSMMHAKRSPTVVAKGSRGASTGSAKSVLQASKFDHSTQEIIHTRPCSGSLSLFSPLRPTRFLSRANVGKCRGGDLAPSPPIDQDNFLSPDLCPPSPLRSGDPGATSGRQGSAGSTVASPFEGRDGPIETVDLMCETAALLLELVKYRGDIGHGAL